MVSFVAFWAWLLLPSAVFAKWDINEVGRIPVLEYHRIMEGESQFIRTPKEFRADLEWLYNNDYYMIPISDFLNQNFAVPRGKKPVLIVFDDSDQTQFNILENGKIDPDSAIGIMNDFYLEHPDFGSGEVFYINASLFGQKEYRQAKLAYLLKTGRELGNHTYNHVNLREIDVETRKEELASIQGLVNDVLGYAYPMPTLAYPFGAVPGESTGGLAAVQSGSFNSDAYEIELGLLVGADPTWPPYYKDYEAMFVPRIQVIDEEWERWFQRVPGATAYQDEAEIFYPFVSDGDPNVISVTASRRDWVIDKWLKKGLTVCVMDETECQYQSNVKGNKIDVKLLKNSLLDVQNFERAEEKQEENAKDSDDTGSGTSQPVTIPVFTGERGDLWLGLEKSAGRLAPDSYLATPNKLLVMVRDAIGLPTAQLGFNELPEDLLWDGEHWTYEVSAGESLTMIASRYFYLTDYLAVADFETALREKNRLAEDDDIQPGASLVLPNVSLVYVDFLPNVPYKSGIYMTGYTAGSRRGQDLADKLASVGGTAVVFDIKEVDGEVFYDSQLPLVKEMGNVSERLPDVRRFVRSLHNRGLYAIARITVCKDHTLAEHHPEWMVQSISGGPWLSGEGAAWMDCSHPEVVKYNLDLIREVSAMGIDEVQLDYIRFPAEGSTHSTKYWYEENTTFELKQDVIVDFVRQAHQAVADYGVELSADVFGVVAWNDGVDAFIVGQDIARMAQYLDVICPMIYPSHFSAGFAGKDDPSNEPYFFIHESTKKFLKLVEGTGAEVRPWLQAFDYRVDNYNSAYVQAQVDALKDLHADGYLMWNAANRYDEAWGSF